MIWYLYILWVFFPSIPVAIIERERREWNGGLIYGLSCSKDLFKLKHTSNTKSYCFQLHHMFSQKHSLAPVEKNVCFSFYFIGAHVKAIGHLAFLIIAAHLKGPDFWKWRLYLFSHLSCISFFIALCNLLGEILVITGIYNCPIIVLKYVLNV